MLYVTENSTVKICRNYLTFCCPPLRGMPHHQPAFFDMTLELDFDLSEPWSWTGPCSCCSCLQRALLQEDLPECLFWLCLARSSISRAKCRACSSWALAVSVADFLQVSHCWGYFSWDSCWPLFMEVSVGWHRLGMLERLAYLPWQRLEPLNFVHKEALDFEWQASARCSPSRQVHH